VAVKRRPTKARASAARKSSGAQAKGIVCNVTPFSLGPFTFPAGGGAWEIFVLYPSGPDACPYKAKPNVRWIRTNPRISEFDLILAPNTGPARRGIVRVQGQFNSTVHSVRVNQLGP
jgi:hypothetical protein